MKYTIELSEEQKQEISKPKPTKMKKALIIKKKWLDKFFDEGKIWEMKTSELRIENFKYLYNYGKESRST